MAESISEGTLSSFTKQVGDHVEQDEEIASIETDKIDVSVNAPAAGVITELLVGEGDTVTVGQDLAKIDAGASGGGAEKGSSEPKSPASDAQETSSQPEGQKEQPTKDDKPASKQSEGEMKETPPPPPPKEPQQQQEPKKESKPEPKQQPKQDSKPKEKDSDKSAAPAPSPFGKGSRGEHRVSWGGRQADIN